MSDRKCSKCGKNEPGPGGILCPGCAEKIRCGLPGQVSQ